MKKEKNIFSGIPKVANISARIPEKLKKKCQQAADKTEAGNFNIWLIKKLHQLTK